MHQTAQPLADELKKEISKLKDKVGSKRMMSDNAALDTKATATTGSAASVSPGPDIPADLSLLWPPGSTGATCHLDENSIRDLGLDDTIRGIACGVKQEHRESIKQILLQLCNDPAVIGYRQDVVNDLLCHPRLVAGLQELLSSIQQLSAYSLSSKDMLALYQVTWWLGELETYVECIQMAGNLFRQVGGELGSAGLRRVRDAVASIERDEAFRNLARELPAFLSRMRGVLSITIGVNLDPDLRPVEATLISVNDQRFSEAPLLKLLLGQTDEYETVMPLHSVPVIPSPTNPLGSQRMNPLMLPLFRDLSRVMEQVSQPIAQALEKYVHLNRRFLTRLAPELAFYLGAVALFSRIKASGLPLCKPELAPREERVCQVENGYNLNLALHLLDREGRTDLSRIVVKNNVALGDEGRIIILTGPNQGGKTTYMQGIGLMQMLAQVGLYVPGSRARISPVDNICTHYPTEEDLSKGTGRFGDEAQRLSEIFDRVTPHSLVLLNESLSGTYAGESLYLATDLVRILRRIGARAIFVTHFHELAAQVDALNAESPGDSLIVSMVSSRIDPETTAQRTAPGGTSRTYLVVKSQPMGRSYARELAARYGISLEQLVNRLRERGVLHSSDRSVTGH